MDKEKLIRESLLITCFLENINTNEKDRIIKILKSFYDYSIDELKQYYEINSKIKDLRIDRMLKYYENMEE